jgi:hypothetical protein
MKARGVPRLDQPDQGTPVNNMIGFQYQGSLLLRKGKPFDYPAQECRFLRRVKPFGGDQIGKKRLKGLYLTDDVYFRKAELKGEETEAANCGNAKNRSSPLSSGASMMIIFPTVSPCRSMPISRPFLIISLEFVPHSCTVKPAEFSELRPMEKHRE